MSQPERIPAETVKQLRDLTGAGMMECKRALVEAGGEIAAAQQLLRTRGLASAEKRQSRRATEGLVEAYVHGDGRIGALVEVNSETDFVARTEEFRRLARDMAMQVAAREQTRWVSRQDVPEDVIASERKIYAEQARNAGKPEQVIDRIVDGKLEAFYKETVLLDQPFIKDLDRPVSEVRTVNEVVGELAANVGENVVVRRFVRFQRGEEP